MTTTAVRLQPFNFIIAPGLSGSAHGSLYIDDGVSLNPDPEARIKTTDAAKLQDEYAKLVEGLQESLTDQTDTDAFMGTPGGSPP